DETTDGTDPQDPCDYNPDSITLPQSGDYLTADCDGDGVTNEDETTDGTDPLDGCDYVAEHQTQPTSTDWNAVDCDGDGVTNEDETTDGTDPQDPCDYNPDSITLPQSGDYLTADCDGDGVTNEDETTDGTDPLDGCDYVAEHQTQPTSTDWNAEDCDGDGVTNEDETTDGTDPQDPCDYNPDSITLPQSGDYLTADCDGDGVTNEDETTDGTDPLDGCDYVAEHQTQPTSTDWNAVDCDGDGVTNEDETTDGTDPQDPCDYNPDSITLTPSADWESLDCDNDGNPNGTDPNPLVATATDDSGSTQALTEVVINILENDDYLSNSDPNNLGTTSLTRIGGDASGTLSMDAETGLLTYTPLESESNSSITIIYQVCNVDPDPNVCASATVTITVGSNTIDAVEDDYSATPIAGDVGGTIPDSNVLLNDTLNGETVSATDVILTSTPTDVLTINEDGSVTVTPGSEEGTYTVSYTICEVANPDNCDTATVTVVVGPGMENIIDAVEDDYSGTPIAGDVGGTIPDSNVLLNDTLNGETVSATDVILTSTPTDVLTINGDGSVTVTPGSEEGTYTVSYTICEAANTDNCDTATVTVVVGPGMENIIDAVEDDYSGTPIDGDFGGIIPDSNVLLNDTLNGETVSATDVILTSTPTDVLTINEDGSVTVTPGSEEGTYTVSYTICEAANTDNCDTATVTVVVGPGMENIIDAVEDDYSGTPIDGDFGGIIPDSNVLLNDTLNGEIVSATDVILTSTPTDVLTINDDGSVSVAPNTEEGSYTISYTICEAANTDNCDTATVTVSVEETDEDEKIEVNQLVTPNGDGKNDFLFIRGVRNANNNSIKIYNRWGVSVYEGNGYNNQNNVFDGRSKARSTITGSDYLPAGVYYYIFQYENNQQNITDSGYIYISK
ncbi:gliding motility-associated C-terminal domain-containing protein, partial [Arenibacter aquaticus]